MAAEASGVALPVAEGQQTEASPLLAIGAIPGLFPDVERLKHCTLTALDEGFSSAVYLATPGAAGSGHGGDDDGGALVVRVGRTASSLGGYATEEALLTWVADHCKDLTDMVALPVPLATIGKTVCNDLGLTVWGGSVSPFFEGVAPSPEWLAEDPRRFDGITASVAAFLSALHSVVVPVDGPLIATRSPWVDNEETWETCRPVITDRMTAEEAAVVAAWWDSFAAFCASDKATTHPVALVHGDLWYGNTLASTAAPWTLTAVLDWECACRGDPAQDFAPLVYCGPAFLDAVIERYTGVPSGDGFGERIKFLTEIREFGGLAWSIRNDDEEELCESLDKIRASSIFSPAEGSAAGGA